MALIDLILPSSRIAVDDEQGFSVQGLNFNDVTWIIHESITDVDAAVEYFQGQKLDSSADPEEFQKGIERILEYLVLENSELTARIIACASGDRGEGAVSIAGRLPVPVQVDALQEIFRLTFSAPGGIKKFVESVRLALLALSNSLKTFRTATSA